MSKIIYYNIPRYGYGDMLVGLVSTYLIADKMRIPFEFASQVDLSSIVKCRKFNDNVERKVNLLNPESLKRAEKWISLLGKKAKTWFVVSNQAWHFLLYWKMYSERKFIKDTRRIYQRLYTRILVPRRVVKDYVKRYIHLQHGIFSIPMIGIQIRCGDYSMNDNDSSNVYLKMYQFVNVADRICQWVRENGISKTVFITSDNNIFLVVLRSKLREYNIRIVETSFKPVHFKSANETERFEIIAEHYLLSKCKQFLICKDLSNFGLTAALASGSNSVWTFDKEYAEISRLHFDKWEDVVKSNEYLE